MSSPIETTPFRPNTHAPIVDEHCSSQLAAAASREMQALPGLYDVVPDGHKIKMEVFEALSGNREAALAVQRDLHNLAQNGKLAPVLEYLAESESTHTLPTAKVEFETKSDRIASITFNAGQLDPVAKFGSMKFKDL